MEYTFAVTELGVVFSSDDENKEDEDETVVDGQLMSSQSVISVIAFSRQLPASSALPDAQNVNYMGYMHKETH